MIFAIFVTQVITDCEKRAGFARFFFRCLSVQLIRGERRGEAAPPAWNVVGCRLFVG